MVLVDSILRIEYSILSRMDIFWFFVVTSIALVFFFFFFWAATYRYILEWNRRSGSGSANVAGRYQHDRVTQIPFSRVLRRSFSFSLSLDLCFDLFGTFDVFLAG